MALSRPVHGFESRRERHEINGLRQFDRRRSETIRKTPASVCEIEGPKGDDFGLSNRAIRAQRIAVRTRVVLQGGQPIVASPPPQLAPFFEPLRLHRTSQSEGRRSFCANSHLRRKISECEGDPSFIWSRHIDYLGILRMGVSTFPTKK